MALEMNQFFRDDPLMKYLSMLFIIVWSFVAFAQPSSTSLSSTEPLAVDQAFQFSAAARDNQTILAEWNLAPGYYLYRDRFHFTIIKPKNATLGQPILPEGITKANIELGKYQIFENHVVIPIPVLNSPSNEITLEVQYQGCSEAGFCYPPMTRSVTIDLSKNYMSFIGGASVTQAEAQAHQKKISGYGILENFLAKKSLVTVLLTFLGFGILISFTPCILPMIPILSGIILGQQNLTTRRALILSIIYVMGMAITYAIAGMLFGLLGGTLQAALQKPWLIVVFSALYALMALSLFGFFNLELPESWRGYFAHLSQKQKSGTYLGTAFMGVFSTLILSPCVTPPLVAVLGYISHTGNAALGGAALFMTGLGMGIPLILIGIGGAKFLPKTGPWMIAVKNLLGLLLLGVAILMLQRVTSGLVTMLLWAALMIGTGIYLDALNTAENYWGRLRKTLGLIFFIYGIILVVGATQGNYDPLHPLTSKECDTVNAPTFQPVKTQADITKALESAQSQKKITILDFYADWCISCIEMDHETFRNPKVIAALKNVVLLRADVTANDSDDKSLQQHYGVIAPPTVIFFDAQGNEVKDARVVGKVSAADFLQHLQSASQ